MATADENTTAILKDALKSFPAIEVAAIFGSIANNTATIESDLDIAVQARHALSAKERIAITEALALAANRPVDLIDLRTAGQPLLHEIVSKGQQILGTRSAWGDLMFRNIMENEDFVPYQQRILEGRRKAWIDS